MEDYCFKARTQDRAAWTQSFLSSGAWVLAFFIYSNGVGGGHSTTQGMTITEDKLCQALSGGSRPPASALPTLILRV